MADNIQIAEAFQALFKPKRFKVFYGGRGGAKTISFVKAAVAIANANGKRFLCLREFMNSIDESVHAALSQEIAEEGYEDGFNVTKTFIDGHNGSAFRYSQLARNIASLKSKHNFDIAWVEEAETVTEKSLDYLIPTIRKPNSELWFSFNPVDEIGAVYKRFVKPHLAEIRANGFYEDDLLYVGKVGLMDNHFAPTELVDEYNAMKRDNYKKWLHIYDGECFADYEDSIIQPEWVDAAIDAHKKLNFKAEGVKVLGFDPADSGDDAKAIAMRHGSVVGTAKQWTTGELPDAIDIAFSHAYDNRIDILAYDADGLGAGVKVGLDKRIDGRRLKVEAYKGGSAVDNPDDEYIDGDGYDEGITNKDTFFNKRAQYWWYLRDRFEKTYNAIEHGVYSNPDELISLSSDLEHLEQLKSELVKVQRKRTNNSKIQMESKVDMKKRGVPSPNLADALVICFANKPLRLRLKRKKTRRVTAMSS